MKQTPQIVRTYILLAAFLIALPTIGTRYYPGQSGKFLVASESIRFEPFRESVIYISRHNVFGAFGLVINKPIDPEKLKELDVDVPENAPQLFLGGPVGFPDKSFALFAEVPQLPQEDHAGDKGLSLAEVIKRVERYPEKEVFIGYSGWGPLQLDIELLRGSWTIIDAPKETIFKDDDPFTLWRELKKERAPDQYEDHQI